ncbi:hypothetical protein, partial [Caulobacter sp. 17J65-9]|uniref:hypothetical protein n=1 Tax=Caulobacter sp. 17J65-9 TaxID=2709382 RepID=UPI0013CD75EE
GAAGLTGRAGRKAGAAATATFHFVGDLNGDGRCDVEDLRIAKDAMAKAAADVLGHPMVKDAAARALLGGAIGSAIPGIGTGAGAAIGAVLAARVIDVGADLAVQALKPSPKPKTKRSQARPKSKR